MLKMSLNKILYNKNEKLIINLRSEKIKMIKNAIIIYLFYSNFCKGKFSMVLGKTYYYYGLNKEHCYHINLDNTCTSMDRCNNVHINPSPSGEGASPWIQKQQEFNYNKNESIEFLHITERKK